jgi:N-acetylglucosaminyl-diphospho-decaprenol L-rhamnosyltransferase
MKRPELPAARVDIVVVSYNSRGQLARCIENLHDLTGVQVIVVDNASSDGSADVSAQLGVETVRLNRNGGFGHGCNAGWRRGNSPFVLFLNPDTTIDVPSLSKLVRLLEITPRAGIAAPRIVGEDGSLDYSQRRFPQLASTYGRALFLHRVFPRAPWTDELIREPEFYEHRGSPDWVSGACLLVRRRLLERLDGFDERFFMYCEDIDLCRRVRDEGFDIVFEPESVSVHGGGASAPRSALLPVLAASRIYYSRKHESALHAALEQVGIGLEAMTHSLLTRRGAAARRGHTSALRVAASRGAVDWSD